MYFQKLVLSALVIASPIAAQHDHDSMPGMGGMNMSGMNPAGMYLMDLASGTSANPASSPMPMIMTHFGRLEHDVHGRRVCFGHAAIRPARRRQTLFDELVHGVGRAHAWARRRLCRRS